MAAVHSISSILMGILFKSFMNRPSAHNASVEADVGAIRLASHIRQAAAWAVHAYTASGAVAGFIALQAAFAGQAREAFLWMLVAVLIDATDGTLARAVQIKRVLPWFDGAKLDDIVDYFTFVIIPVALLVQMHLLPSSGTILFAALPLLASAYGFCQAAAKTPDFFFTGFPSYWNIVAFYLYVGGLPTWVNGAVICLLSICVFIPIRYIYPTRTVPFRGLTNGLGIGWVGVLLTLLYQLPSPSGWLVLCSLYYPIYYTVLSFYLHAMTTKVDSAP
jgi:phosphatidylcholine synthase